MVGAATGDVDGDGALDLVVVREGGGFSVMKPELDGTLTEVTTGSVLAEATALLVVDIDEDGKADWIIGEAADRLAVFRSGEARRAPLKRAWCWGIGPSSWPLAN